MDSALPSKPYDDEDVKPTFRKPSNEMATRKYRRHSPVDGSDSSSSGGNPRCERSPVYSAEDHAKTHSDRQRRDEKRILESDSGGNRSSKGSDSQGPSDRQTSYNSHESRRNDDHNRQKRHANEEDRGYHRSSRSDRDFGSGILSDYTRRDSNYERSRESWRNVCRYTKDRSDNVGRRSDDKARDGLISDHHKHDEKDLERAAHGSKPGNSSRHDVRTGDGGRCRDREALDERSDRRRSPGDKNNDELQGHIKGLVVGRDSGTCHSKDARERSNKELDGLRNDQLHKRKQTSKESDEQKCTRELGTSESESSTFHDKERRKGLVPENQNSSDKKLKLVQEEGEKPFPSSKQVETAGKFTIQPSSSATNQVDTAQNLDAAEVKAMQAAELVNKNLVGGGYMSTDQKKKLLWGSKKNTTTTQESSKRWDLHSFADQERQEKFNKLMGVKGEVKLGQKPGGRDGSLCAEQQEQLKIDLERQYTAGLRRRDGRTVGLGL